VLQTDELLDAWRKSPVAAVPPSEVVLVTDFDGTLAEIVEDPSKTVARQDALLATVHQQMVDEALMLWVVHDVNPHVISPKVKEFVQAQHWFQDLTTVRMSE